MASQNAGKEASCTCLREAHFRNADAGKWHAKEHVKGLSFALDGEWKPRWKKLSRSWGSIPLGNEALKGSEYNSEFGQNSLEKSFEALVEAEFLGPEKDMRPYVTERAQESISRRYVVIARTRHRGTL